MPQDSFFNSIRNMVRSKPSEEERRKHDELVRRLQANEPRERRIARKGFEGILDSIQGLLIGPRDEEVGPTARNFGALLGAGLPFSSYANKGINRVFHGTQRLFDKFDPSKYDTSDVLGWMTHFAENPKYAGEHYAMGRSKGLVGHIPEEGGELTKSDLMPNFQPDPNNIQYIATPRMIPAKPEAKNVLDLVDPNPDDLSQALAAIEPYERRSYLDLFKNVRRQTRLEEKVKEIGPKSLAFQWINENHLPDKMTFDEVPIRVLADRIRLTPETFKKTPFDAIRYRDNEHKSWAIPAETPIRSAITPSLELSDVPKNLKIFRTDNPNVGTNVQMTDARLNDLLMKYRPTTKTMQNYSNEAEDLIKKQNQMSLESATESNKLQSFPVGTKVQDATGKIVDLDKLKKDYGYEPSYLYSLLKDGPNEFLKGWKLIHPAKKLSDKSIGLKQSSFNIQKVSSDSWKNIPEGTYFITNKSGKLIDVVKDNESGKKFIIDKALANNYNIYHKP